MSTIKLQNNFSNFKADFTKDTGLQYEKEKELYTQYVNARLADYNMQLGVEIVNKLLNLPREIAFSIQQGN